MNLKSNQLKYSMTEHLSKLLEDVGMTNIKAEGNSISFQRKNKEDEINILSINGEGEGVRLMDFPWLKLMVHDPATSVFWEVVDQAKTRGFSQAEVVWFKSYDENELMFASQLDVNVPIFEITEKLLGHEILGMSIMKEWVISHFLLEIENRKI